jgi:hypothetical protein
MAKRYYIAVGIVLGLTLLTELYFGTVFNESVRHPFDIPALLFVAPGLLLNHFLNLDLSFDGPNHSAVILLSGLVYATVSVGIVATVQKVWKRCSQQAASDEPC